MIDDRKSGLTLAANRERRHAGSRISSRPSRDFVTSGLGIENAGVNLRRIAAVTNLETP
ncbi:MAG: hypothetical protein M3Y67_07075 [Pseudomonadota bacterium]|nr:hypothetical protein [Pseudomonadota bacterium]